MLSFDVYLKKNLIENIIDEVLAGNPEEKDKEKKEAVKANKAAKNPPPDKTKPVQKNNSGKETKK